MNVKPWHVAAAILAGTFAIAFPVIGLFLCVAGALAAGARYDAEDLEPVYAPPRDIG